MFTDKPLIELSKLRNPLFSIIILIFLIFCGTMLFQIIGIFFISIFFKINFFLNESNHFIFKLSNKMPTLIIQIFSAFGGFVIAPLLYLKKFEKNDIKIIHTNKNHFNIIFIVMIIALSFIILNTILIKWNISVSFPQFMKSFEEWAQYKEVNLEKLTIFLTNFESKFNIYFFICLIGLAVIPSIGEEIIFRYILQNLFHKILKNSFLSILFTAFIFSAIHIQFYSFFPRFLLGILFGYLYWWSRDILYPIIAHFFNNTFSLIFIFYIKEDIIEKSIKVISSSSFIIIFFFMINFFSIYLFRRIFLKN